MRTTTAMIAASLMAVGAAAASCSSLGGAFDCPAQQTSYQSAIANDGVLQDSIAEEGPFPMAMVMSADAVNTMLRGVLDQSLPPIVVSDSGATLTAHPSIPIVQIVSIADCPSCVLADMEFDMDVEVPFLGTQSGTGAVTMALPVSMQPKGTTATGLIAQLDQADILSLDIDINGFALSDFPGIQSAFEDETTSYVREEFGATEVVELDSWKIGAGDVMLAARGPMLFPESGTILMGLNTNLSLPPGATLAEQATLPEDAQMGMQFHPELLLSMSKRLMTEGEIPQDLDEDGNEDSAGNNHVSMDSMVPSDGMLHTAFTVWRTGGGVCGFAKVGTDMALSINESQIDMAATNVQIEDSDGAGDFVNNQWIAGDFLKELTNNLELTVNYKEFSVEGDGKTVVPSATSLNVTGQGLSIYMDLNLEESGE